MLAGVHGTVIRLRVTDRAGSVADTVSADNKIAWYGNTDGAGTFGDEQVISTAADAGRSVYATYLDGDGDVDAMDFSRFIRAFTGPRE